VPSETTDYFIYVYRDEHVQPDTLLHFAHGHAMLVMLMI